jgi:hypothetical protein
VRGHRRCPGLHVIPGFHNPKVLDAVVVGPQSIPFSMYFNMDKAVVPFFLITCMPTLFVAKPLYKSGQGRLGNIGSCGTRAVTSGCCVGRAEN